MVRGLSVAGLVLLVSLVAACESETVDLDVSTSVLDIETTTTTTEPPPTTTTTRPTTTTTEPGPEPIIPDVARVVPLRPVLLSNDDGTDAAVVSPEEIIDWVLTANEIFGPARIGFSYDPTLDIDIIQDTLANGLEGPDSARWFDRVVRANELAARYPGELVVFFRSEPGDQEIGSHHLNFVIMGEWEDELVCGEPDRTLLGHRIGLYLGVPHTFAAIHETSADAADTLSDALQDPDVFDGDTFPATPPDPAVYPEHRCSGEQAVMIGGLEFELPRSNIMSHYEERSELSLAQADRARWTLDLREANQMAAPSNAVMADTYEAEDVLVATRGPCGLGSVEDMGHLVGYQWVEADQLVFPAAEGCMLDFEIPVASEGSYRLVALATRSPDHGAVEFLVDGEPFTFADLYAPLVVASGPIQLGESTLGPGSIIITVEVVGTNTLSSGSSVGIDGFALVPTN